jgi:hypothetical protein
MSTSYQKVVKKLSKSLKSKNKKLRRKTEKTGYDECSASVD